MDKGYKITPVNPKENEILGAKSFLDLVSIPHPIDIVDVFRRSDLVMPIIDEAIKIGAKAVWLQEGVVSLPAFKRGEEAGLIMIMDKCILKEHSQISRR
jgi:predicted CoA-binding protein